MPNLKHVEVLRWIGVLPAAFLGAFAARFVGGIAGYAAAHALGSESGSTVALLTLLLAYGIGTAAFVLAGALAAPRHRAVVAIALAAICVIVSLLTHVLSQGHPGRTNYLHLAAETVGAVLAAGYALCMQRRKRSD